MLFFNFNTARYSKIRSLTFSNPKWSASNTFRARFKLKLSFVVSFLESFVHDGEIPFPKTQPKDPNPECKTCKGLGMQPNWNKSYNISLENIQNFAEFLVNCGGFQIC